MTRRLAGWPVVCQVGERKSRRRVVPDGHNLVHSERGRIAAAAVFAEGEREGARLHAFIVQPVTGTVRTRRSNDSA